jgi:16S rRNA (guanine1207-N2)-methyltransferase
MQRMCDTVPTMRVNAMHSQSLESYRQERTLTEELGDVPVRLVTRPGFPDWGHISQAARLIASYARITAGERVLLCPCGHGALGVWATHQTAPRQIALLDTNIVAVEMARRTLAANQGGDVRIEAASPGPSAEPYDVALMTLPKGRDLARLYFLGLYQALRPGGRLYLAGANREGIKSVISDAAALFGPETLLAYKGGNRIVVFTRGPSLEGDLPSTYHSAGLAKGTYWEFPIQIHDESFTVRTRPGVFSWRNLDTGTRLLLDVLEVHVTDRVLDVGCGYGIIGMFAARKATKGQVTLLDVDVLAYDCARESLALNGLEQVQVLLSDGLAAIHDQRFTLIVSNPAFHTGHAVTSDIAPTLIHEAYEALEPHGHLVLVANRFLPYDQLMQERFGTVVTLAQTSQYHVLSAEKAYEPRSRGKPARAGRKDRDEETIYQLPDDW